MESSSMLSGNNGLVFNIRGFSVHDGPGIRTTVFMKGCPLRCFWCHNPESQHPASETWTTTQRTGTWKQEKSEPIGQNLRVEQVLKHTLHEKPFYEISGGGVTISGGEPLSQPHFVTRLLQSLKDHGVHTCLDTSGHGSWHHLSQMMAWADLFLFDLKLADSDLHRKHTGVGNELILENLKNLHRSGANIHVRIPLVEKITDTPSNIAGLQSILGALPGLERIDLLPFHRSAKEKYNRLNRNHGCSNMPAYPARKAREVSEHFNGLAKKIHVNL